MSEREQADRWWAEVREHHSILRYRYANPGSSISDPSHSKWWRTLTDGRAIAIYKQESGQ